MTDTLPTDADRDELDLLLHGFKISRILQLVADLRVADKIPIDDQITVKDLAATCAVLPEPLLRVLRALAAVQIFQLTPDGRVAHTPRSRLLRTDTPNTLHHAARFWTGPGSWGAWAKLDVAMTGGIPHEAAWNMGRYDYLRQHPDEARVFDEMMANYPDNRHAAIAAAYDFSAAGLIVDVGGGNGAALRHILTRFPGHAWAGPGSRGCRWGNQARGPNGRTDRRPRRHFLDRVPSGADLYMLIRVVHNWSDEDCGRILQTCHAAMAPHARLLIGEEILEPDPARGRPTSYLIDL